MTLQPMQLGARLYVKHSPATDFELESRPLANCMLGSGRVHTQVVFCTPASLGC